jgi:hypothetical protein
MSGWFISLRRSLTLLPLRATSEIALNLSLVRADSIRMSLQLIAKASGTVSLPLSVGLSSVLPPLIPWLIQLLLAAQPMTGNRWVLWRLRCHTGVRTQAKRQLRQSCISACVSGAMVGCPVRPFLLLDCSWPENADFRVVHQSYLPEFSAWLCNSPCAMSSV